MESQPVASDVDENVTRTYQDHVDTCNSERLQVSYWNFPLKKGNRMERKR